MRFRVRVLLVTGLLCSAGCGGGGDETTSESVADDEISSESVTDDDTSFESVADDETSAESAPDATRPASSGTLFAELRLASRDDATAVHVIAALDLDRGGMRRIASTGTGERWAVAPDGGAVAIATPWSDAPLLSVIDTASGAIRWELPMSGWLAHEPVWSHGGDAVAVLRGEGTSGAPLDLAVVDARSGEIVVEVGVEPPREGSRPVVGWTADDSTLVVGMPGRGVGAVDGEPVPLPVPTDQPPASLIWAPAGDHVLRLAFSDVSVFTADGRSVVSFDTSIVWAGAREPWSPDGSRLVLLSVAEGEGGSTEPELVVVEVDESPTSPPTLVRTGPHTELITWSPDGDEIAVAESNRITIHPVDGGPPRDAIVLDIDQGTFVGTSLAWRDVAAGGDPIELPTVEPLGAPGTIEAVRAATGAMAWTATLPGDPIEVGIGGGVIVDTTLLVAVGRHGAPQAVAGLDPDTGELLWTTTVGTLAALTTGGGRVIAATPDDVVALDAHDGSITWRKPMPSPTMLQAADDSIVVIAHSWPPQLTALGLDSGDERWTTTVCEQCLVERLAVGEHVYAAVAEHTPDRATASVVALDPVTGEPRWNRLLCEGCSPFAGLADTRPGPLVLTRDHAVVLDPADGDFRWSTTLAQPFRLAATDDAGFVLDELGLHAFDLESGEERWGVPGGYAVTADDTVVVTVGPHPNPQDGEGHALVTARDTVSGDVVWQRAATDTPFGWGHGSGIVASPLPAAALRPPEPEAAPMVLVGGWRLADGDPPDEYLFTRDGASVECWSTPITEVHTFESYLEDRRAEARREPDEITVDGRSGWLFEFGATAFEAFWQESGHTMALRTYDLASDEFCEVLAAARHVSESEWQAAFDADRAAVDPPP